MADSILAREPTAEDESLAVALYREVIVSATAARWPAGDITRAISELGFCLVFEPDALHAAGMRILGRIRG